MFKNGLMSPIPEMAPCMSVPTGRLKLVAFTASQSRSSASTLEYAVKSLSQAQKRILAEKWNAGW